MESHPKLLRLQSLANENIASLDESLKSENCTQLSIDAHNVYIGDISISLYSEEYQEKIKAYNRFYGYRYSSKASFIAPRTNDTLDVI